MADLNRMTDETLDSLQITLGKAKAIADAYSALHVEQEGEAPYLFAALEDLIAEAYTLANKS